jgi:8-oxo-dGTP pyrophosphatase MutT (NUDIX family)
MAAPRAASTVVLLRERRDARCTLETFLLRRPASGAFADAHVFPGGRVDVDDADQRWQVRCRGLDALAVRLRDHLGREGTLGHAVAAAREVFEETGVLLGASPTLDRDAAAAGRADLLARRTSFLAWCEAHGVHLALDRLLPWAHWITPEVEPHRFDAWFFLAALLGDQEASIIPGETLEGRWMSLGDALAAAAQETIRLSPPTLRTVEELRRYPRLDDLPRASAARRLTAVMPRALPGAADLTLVLPGDATYATSLPCGVEGPTRFVLRGKRWTSESGEA